MAKGGFLGSKTNLLLSGGASLPTYLMAKKGGGGAPATPPPVPLPSAPISPHNDASVAAEHDLAQQNFLKKSVKKTILAGDTGGYLTGNPNPANSPVAPTSYAQRTK